MSLLRFDVMTMFPSVVYVGVVAFAALSAEILVPPDPAVTVTAANALLAPQECAERRDQESVVGTHGV